MGLLLVINTSCLVGRSRNVLALRILQQEMHDPYQKRSKDPGIYFLDAALRSIKLRNHPLDAIPFALTEANAKDDLKAL